MSDVFDEIAEAQVSPYCMNGRHGKTWLGVTIMGVTITRNNLESGEFIRVVVPLLQMKLAKLLEETKG